MFSHTRKGSNISEADDTIHPSTTSRDLGPNPSIINIDDLTLQNETFRTAIWTGSNLQITLMSINIDEDVGLENHTDTDQFIFVKEGVAVVRVGLQSREILPFKHIVRSGNAIVIPSGTWHNIINIGPSPLKLYSIYGPPNHPAGTIHISRIDDEEE